MSRRINIHEHVEATIPAQELIKLAESAKASDGLPDKITTVVEAIHSGLTRNYTFYPAENLEKSVQSWTQPFRKPVIKNHNTNEEPLGRVMSAKFIQSNIAPDKQTIELELEITDKEAIKKVLDGRYHTLSIGGSTNSAVCSVCGKDLVKEGYCGHMKGRTYEGKQAHWIIGEMAFDEISWVNVPADSNAQVVHKNTAAKQTEATSTEEGGMTEMEKQTNDILDQIDGLVGTAESEGTEDKTQTDAAGTEAGNQQEEAPEGQEGKENEEQPEGTQKEATEDETLQEQLDAALERIATLETDNTTLGADLETLQESNTQLTQERDTAIAEANQFKADLALADAENKTLTKQSVTLATYTHKVLVESVAALQTVLGKVEEGALESTMAELSKQTSRSLKEQLSELGKEKPMRVVQTVEHPSATAEGETATTKESTSEKEKTLTLEEYAEKISAALNRQFN